MEKWLLALAAAAGISAGICECPSKYDLRSDASGAVAYAALQVALPKQAPPVEPSKPPTPAGKIPPIPPIRVQSQLEVTPPVVVDDRPADPPPSTPAVPVPEEPKPRIERPSLRPIQVPQRAQPSYHWPGYVQPPPPMRR